MARFFTSQRFYQSSQSSRLPAKLFLLDQSKVAGLGNIYAAEALFRAAISPYRAMNSLVALRLTGSVSLSGMSCAARYNRFTERTEVRAAIACTATISNGLFMGGATNPASFAVPRFAAPARVGAPLFSAVIVNVDVPRESRSHQIPMTAAKPTTLSRSAEFRKKLESGIVVADGAMGTMLTPKACSSTAASMN